MTTSAFTLSEYDSETSSDSEVYPYKLENNMITSTNSKICNKILNYWINKWKINRQITNTNQWIKQFNIIKIATSYTKPFNFFITCFTVSSQIIDSKN